MRMWVFVSVCWHGYSCKTNSSRHLVHAPLVEIRETNHSHTFISISTVRRRVRVASLLFLHVVEEHMKTVAESELRQLLLSGIGAITGDAT